MEIGGHNVPVNRFDNNKYKPLQYSKLAVFFQSDHPVHLLGRLPFSFCKLSCRDNFIFSFFPRSWCCPLTFKTLLGRNNKPTVDHLQ